MEKIDKCRVDKFIDKGDIEYIEKELESPKPKQISLWD